MTGQVDREWIEAHGSERLRKAAALGLLEQSRGIYLDERLALEAPGFFWAGSSPRWRWEESEIRNPSLAALTELEKAPRQTWPGAKLVKIRAGRGDAWLEAIRLEGFPWAPGRIAYHTIA